MKLFCRIAESEEDIKKVIEFRYNFLCIWNNFLKTRESQIESISDKFDNYSKYILCEDEHNTVRGVVRLIVPETDSLFMDQFINRKDYIKLKNKKNNFIELSEFITHKDFRNNYKIIYNLILYCSNYLLNNNYEYAASISTKSVHNLLNRLGFKKHPVSFISEWGGEMTLHTLKIKELNKTTLNELAKKLGIILNS